MTLSEVKQKLQRPELLPAAQLKIYRKLRTKLSKEFNEQMQKAKQSPQLSIRLK